MLPLIWSKRRQGALTKLIRTQPIGTEDKPVLNHPGEPNSSKPHSKAYQDGMGLLFILGSVLALIAVIYVLGYFE